MKQKLLLWVEKYLVDPNLIQKIISFLLLPLTLIYCIAVRLKRYFQKVKNFDIPIISIGNLVVGGSGKTPFIIELAKDKKDVAVILRGYGRKSKGLIVVKDKKNILVDTQTSGDEAMLLASFLKNAIVIVSEDRIKAIQKVKTMGAKLIFLDDGFSQVNIAKLDILLKPKVNPQNKFCLPSGGYREPYFLYNRADFVFQEGKDFKRVVNIQNKTSSMVLITAISKPMRLDEFLPSNLLAKYYFPDHYFFKKEELEKIIKKHNATSILTTQKDEVKLKAFNLNLSIILLSLQINLQIKKDIKEYYERYSRKI